MDDFAGLLLLVALFLIFGLRRRVKRLEARITALESGMVAPPEAAAVSPFAPQPETPAEPPATPTLAEAPGLVPETEAPAEPATPPASGLSVFATTRADEPGDSSKPRLAGFEERFGALWTVWLGGLALALGGIFLVRYAIEADLIGPGTRLTLGALLALGLLAGGEWLRRSDRRIGAGLPLADVPAMITAAGTSTAYAVVYAAYELYALLPPGAAFVLLGLVALATMLAALLHGPILAALGLAGAAVAPLLVSTETPSAWGLAIYIAVVVAAALGLARIRLWGWLAALALAAGFVWGMVLLGMPDALGSAAPLGFLIVAITGLTTTLLVPGLLRGPQPGGAARPDPVASIGFAVAILLAAFLTVKAEQGTAALLLFAAVALAAVAAAWKSDAALAGPPVAAPAAAFVLVAWDVMAHGGSTIAEPGNLAGLLDGPPVLNVAGFSTFGIVLGALLGGAGFLGAQRATRIVPALIWSATAVAGPLLILIAAYWRLEGFGTSYAFAAVALILAALGTLAVERLSGGEEPGSLAPPAFAGAAFAAGAVGALALGLTMALEKGWLTVGLALASLGVAWIWSLKRLPGLRSLSAMVGLAVLSRVIWDPTIAGGDPGPTPILNWLLWGYGVPAAAFALAAWRLGGTDWARRVHEGLALLFAVLLAVTQIRHAIYGTLISTEFGLAEVGSLTCVALAYGTVLERLRRAAPSPVYDVGALLALAGALALSLYALTVENPLVFGPEIEGGFVNLLLLAYALPAVLAALLRRAGEGQRGNWHSLACGALALVLGLAYITLQVRRLFAGPDLSGPDPQGAELYAYSAAWLAFGIALLVAGLVSRSRALRFASALIVMLTIAKVFLWDMADLEGVLRALSFIGLGLVLVGIGWLYQHLLLKRRAAATPEAQPPA
ncbi:DUF2339 domain-containing protein [Bosea sp. 117]|uniref:DUF2339 domain-containing protein n=1 Tax=Bosea sp. 117 TaxID=1125973 RepID=UPI0004948412|nr:DUF2339 domain-containing protein [Bosea sp. 117]